MNQRFSLHLGCLTEKPEAMSAVRDTLIHVYPGLQLEVIKKDGPFPPKLDLAIIDVEAMTPAGLDRLLDHAPDIPLLLMIPTFSDAERYRHLIQGRRDLILKGDVKSIALINASHHLIERHRLHQQLLKSAHRMKEMSIRDELTKLFNHHHFHEQLVQEVKKANRYKRPLSLVMLAVKNFHAINDAHGHAEGDRLLTKIASMITGTVRGVDIAGRMGGSQFSIVFPESDEPAAKNAAVRLYRALTSNFPTRPDHRAPIICMGLASVGPDVAGVEELTSAAHAALHEAKKCPDGGVCLASDLARHARSLAIDRQLADKLHDQAAKIGHEAQKHFMQAFLHVVADSPLHKKLLFPHAERVAFFAERLAAKLKLKASVVLALRQAGFLHDMGKLVLASDVLLKPTPLLPAEIDLVRQHPLIAIDILKETAFLTDEIVAIRHHHERYDGTGYPDGLEGEAIPEPARILAIAEAWDAMTAPQPYRALPLTLDAALAELKKGAGRQFDPRLVAEFSALITG